MTANHQPVRRSQRPVDPYLTVPQVAAQLAVSPMTVYRLIHAGALPAHRIGRSIRVREKDFDRYMRGTDMSGWVAEE